MYGKAQLFEEIVAAQKGRLILWLPVFVGIGSALYFALRFEPSPVLGLGALAGLVLAVGLVWPWRQGEAAARVGWVMLVALLWVSVGFNLAQARTQAKAAPMLADEIRFADITGTVAEIEVLEDGGGQRVILTDLVIEELPAGKTPKRVRLKIRDEDSVRIGTRVKTLAGLNAPSPPAMPGAFDFQKYAYFRQIGAFGFTYRPLEILEEPTGQSLRARIEQARQEMVARLQAQMGAREAAFASALMIGEREAIAEADWEAMRASGLAHMLSISGMHVGLIAGVVFFAVRFLLALSPALALKHPIKKYAALVALAAAAFYTFLAVPATPAYRALLMTAFVLMAVVLDRKPFSMRTIALAALVILLARPEAIWSASFQMSFAATAALIYFFEQTAPFWMRWRRQAGAVRRGFLYVAGVCATTIVAGMATAPFAVYHFQQFAALSVLANLLAVPLLTFIVMPFIIVTFIAWPFGWEKPFLWVMGQGIDGIVTIAHEVAALPGAQWIVPSWPMAALVLIVVAALFVMMWAGRARYAMGAVMVAVAVFLIFAARPPDVVVSGDGGLMGVKMADGQLSLSTKRRDRFAAGIWLRAFGQDEDEGFYWPREGAGPGGILCDAHGCRYERDGHKVAFSFEAAGLREDCAWAHIIVARAPVQGDCDADIVIDRFDLWRNGAYAVWFNDKMTHVAAERGQRPWIMSTGR